MQYVLLFCFPSLVFQSLRISNLEPYGVTVNKQQVHYINPSNLCTTVQQQNTGIRMYRKFIHSYYYCIRHTYIHTLSQFKLLHIFSLVPQPLISIIYSTTEKDPQERELELIHVTFMVLLLCLLPPMHVYTCNQPRVSYM